MTTRRSLSPWQERTTGLTKGLDAGHTSVHVLLVEDSAYQREVLKTQVATLGCKISEASSAEEATHKLRVTPPDVVLLDWDLPDADGPGLLADWHKKGLVNDRIVLVVTASPDVERLRCALEAGATDFVRKSADGLELQARLSNALRMRSMQRDLRALEVDDRLTRLLNRHGITARMNTDFERSQAYTRPMSVALIDLDKFGPINERHGVARGDQVLEDFGRVLSRCRRPGDAVGRYDGQAFLLLMPETPIITASSAIERVRSQLQGANAGCLPDLQVDFSAGVANFTGSNFNSSQELLQAAQRMLATAKQAGGGCTKSF